MLFRSSFGNSKEMLTADGIMKEKILIAAKEINETYRGGNDAYLWENLGMFLRQSNISAAEFFPVLRRAEQHGATDRQLVELEHIRWCRFYFMYNWQGGTPRDDENRIHPCLVPYSQLSPKDQNKDGSNVELALGRKLILEEETVTQ